ncbi:MAG: hypothetical protein QNK23_02225 [Crocinitomicaceae bacterium]|nr:hypothetical protein [Crocinitomicaceae bacterium]
MRIKLILPFIALCLIGTACKKKGCTDSLAENYNSSAEKDDNSCTYASTYSTNFDFVHELDGSSFFYDTILYQHPAGQNYSVQTLKYFVSNIVLYKTNGDSVFIDIAHYVNARDAASTTFEYTESIENASYTGIAFVFGLDEMKNTTGAYLNPPENLMEWPIPMGGGYHYMKMEGKYDSLGVTKNYNIHTGAAQGVPHYFKVSFIQPFTVTDNQLHAEITMELNNWFQNPTLFDFDVFGDAIMGDQTAQQAIADNGVDVFSINIIN